MGKVFKIKPIINKRNGQINFSLPKRKLSKKQIIEIEGGKSIKIKLEDLLE